MADNVDTRVALLEYQTEETKKTLETLVSTSKDINNNISKANALTEMMFSRFEEFHKRMDGFEGDILNLKKEIEDAKTAQSSYKEFVETREKSRLTWVISALLSALGALLLWLFSQMGIDLSGFVVKGKAV